MFGFLKSLFSRRVEPALPPPRFTTVDLARRLGVDAAELARVDVSYKAFQVPKRSGGMRTIQAPAPPLMAVQRLILRRLLRRLRAHPNATGFERGHSIVTNALPHVDKDIVIRLDLVNFFPSISADRVERYFRFIGYDQEAATILTRLCTYKGSLPQGAPTSPRLSNLVNYRLDARLAALAESRGLSYSRYADDITFSARIADLAATRCANPKALERQKRRQPRPNDLIHAAKAVIASEGYRLHMHRKLRVSRRHDRQLVTGLVVNSKPDLPRATRRRLRAVADHLRRGRPATLTPQQLAGWHALQAMIAAQRATPAS
ncbi:MAG TPA: reverse transcriptase family protein [Phycisphaerae bacterium]|nr:reverse transcriptase family protein [Phycisphaerae bacterium]